MKSKISIIMMVIILTCTCMFTSCSEKKDENIITYTETDKIKKADGLFGNDTEDKLIDLCTEMVLENKDNDTRENFLMYILAKTTEIDKQRKEDLYPLALNVIKTCIKQPVASITITNGLRTNYKIIDEKLTEITKEFLKGKWIRADKSSLCGMVVLVEETEEDGLAARIISVPSKETRKFKTNDIKWKELNFANHEKFYFSDLACEETIETNYTGEVTSKVLNTYKGAVGTIDFDKNKIKIKYTIKENVTSGANQVWIKEGYEQDAENEEEISEETEKKSNESASETPKSKSVSGFFEE